LAVGRLDGQAVRFGQADLARRFADENARLGEAGLLDRQIVRDQNERTITTRDSTRTVDTADEPSNRTLRDQYVFEAFYSFHITPHTHLTPDIQTHPTPGTKTPSLSAVCVCGDAVLG
jgi:carbohydrate-selective porin OprB